MKPIQSGKQVQVNGDISSPTQLQESTEPAVIIREVAKQHDDEFGHAIDFWLA